MNRPVEDMQPSRIDIVDVITSPFNLLSEHRRLYVPLVIKVVFTIIMGIGMHVGTRAMFVDLTSTRVTYWIVILIVAIISILIHALMEGWR